MMTKANKAPRLEIDEMRLIADLRIMHSKVHELFEVVSVLKRGHEENFIRRYADHAMLEKDIQRVDEIYLWFLTLKEEGLKLKKK
ncbi:MAG TPA: hypothetical protein VLA83_04415 [Candidatus Binatia bacterium]|nr:hypothetical protein [Candidatus Binatia bacterium]